MESDNPDYLTQLIPYRCPRCGDLKRFATLRELKCHLERDHSFKMGCIKPRKRLRVFGQDANDKNILIDNPMMKPSSEIRYPEDAARMSPLLCSYKEEAKILEMQVNYAKQEELRHKLLGKKSNEKETKSSSPSGSGTDSNSYASVSKENVSETHLSNDRIRDSTSVVSHEQASANVPSSLSKTSVCSIPSFRSGYTEFRNVLDSLNQKVIRSRQRQWESAESLYKAEDVLLGMEKAAEENCKEQRMIIQQLLKGLNDKDDTLQSANNELDALQFQKQQILKESEDLFCKADQRNEILRHELEQKERQMSCLKREFEQLKFYTETELKQKDEELKNANKTVKHLEWEQENLTQEAEELLKRANCDREGLKRNKERKEEQLRYVNKELDKLRWEQHDLLEQSIKLYIKADEGTSILKGMLKAKDQQLSNALERLKHMRKVQARLLEESRWLTQQANENSNIMKKLLSRKEEQFCVAQHELEKLRDDEKSFQEISTSFANRTEVNSEIIENLQKSVQRKEEELGKTKTELSSLKKFICETAEKEQVARTKLEKFIGELIDRASRAEKEIRALTQTSDTTSSISQSFVYTNVDDTVNDHIKLTRSPKNGMQYADDFATEEHIYESMAAKTSSAGRQRNSKQPLQKPCITKQNHNPRRHQIVDLGVDSWFDNYSGILLHPAVDSDLKELPGLSATHQVANSSDRNVLDSTRPEETNYSFGVNKQGHDGINNTEADNLQYVQMNGNINSPRYGVQSQGDQQDKDGHFHVEPPFVSHKHSYKSQINANKSDTQNVFRLQGHQKGGKHQERTVQNKIYGQEAGINLKINGHQDSFAQEQYVSDILSPPTYFQDYSSMPCGLNDPKYFRNNVDIDNKNYQYGQGNDEIFKNQQFSYVTQPQSIPSDKEERLNRFSKSEADLPRHFQTQASSVHADHDYQNQRIGTRMTTPRKGYHLSQSAKANRRRPLGILPGPIHINPVGHLSRKPDMSLNETMVQQHNDVDDNSSSSNRCQRKSLSPTAERLDIGIIDPDQNYEVYQEEDSYRFSGDIKSLQNLRKLSVELIPAVRPTRRSYDNDEEEKEVDTVDVNKVNFDQIIDENGILWEDNQDTLPDISDSELDRISPSGTEAVSGKMPSRPITPQYCEDLLISSKQNLQSKKNETTLKKIGAVDRRNHSCGQASQFGSNLHSDVNISGHIYKNPPQKNKSRSSANENISNSFILSKCDSHKRTPDKDVVGSLSARDLHCREQYSSKSLSSNSNSVSKSQSTLDSRSKYLLGEEESKRSKLFQPITSPIAKSGSDQDLTSGGKEVHATFIVRENNEAKFISPGSVHFETYIEENKEELSTDDTLSHASEYNWNSLISDTPVLLTEENYSVKSESETSFRRTDLELKRTRLGPNMEAFIRESHSVKAFKEKLDAVAQKYGVKSRYAKPSEVKKEQLSSCQDTVNSNMNKYRYKSVIAVPSDKADFTMQASSEKTLSPEKSQSPTQLSICGGHSSHAKLYRSDKKPDKGEHSKYEPHLDNGYSFNRDNIDRQYNLDRKPSEIDETSLDMLPVESCEIREGRRASSKKEIVYALERCSCDETYTDQGKQFNNGRFSVSNERLIKKIPTGPNRHESLDGKIDVKASDNSTLSETSSSKRTNPRKLTMPNLSNDAIDEKLEMGECTDVSQINNVWNDVSQHLNVLKSTSDENLDKTSMSNSKHEQKSRDKENQGQDKVKENKPVLRRDVSNEFIDMSQKEEIFKKIGIHMTEEMNYTSSVQNPDDSTKDKSVKHGAGSTLESERNHHQPDHSVDAFEMFGNDNTEGLSHNTRVSINTSYNTVDRLSSLSECHTIKNAITTVGDVHQEDLDDRDKNVSVKDDFAESAQSLLVLQQPGSMFAEPILGSFSIDGDSNAQSSMEENSLTETELDSDSDCRRKSQDWSDGVNKDDFKIRMKRKAYSKSGVKMQTAKQQVLSPASSQASLNQLDNMSYSKLEDTKRRREALYHVFSFLDTATLCQMSAVCKEWKIVSRNPRLWQRVQLKNDKISSQFLMTISKWCTKLKFLTFEDLKSRNRRWGETLEEYSVKIRACLEPGLEQLLKQCESTLISLRIVNCGHLLTSKALWAASGYSRQLQHVTYLSDIDPVGPEVMWALGAGCRDIRTLVIPPLFPCQNIGRFNTKCVQLIGKFFHDLEVLSIGGPDIDLTSFVNVAQSCQRLQSVELTRMSEITAAIATSICHQGLSKLQTLIFTCTPVALDALKIFFKSCAHLKQITIQLEPKDYYTATKKASVKEYEAYVDQLQKLKSKPGLGTILQLNVHPVLKVEGEEKEERSIFSWFTEKFK